MHWEFLRDVPSPRVDTMKSLGLVLQSPILPQSLSHINWLLCSYLFRKFLLRVTILLWSALKWIYGSSLSTLHKDGGRGIPVPPIRKTPLSADRYLKGWDSYIIVPRRVKRYCVLCRSSGHLPQWRTFRRDRWLDRHKVRGPNRWPSRQTEKRKLEEIFNEFFFWVSLFYCGRNKNQSSKETKHM